MKFGVSLALLSTIVFLVTSKFIRKRARLSVSFFAGCSASLLVSFTVVILNFLRADDWKFYLGLAEFVFLLVICLVEFILRLKHCIKAKTDATDNYLKKISRGLQIRAVAFFYSFNEVSRLDSVVQDKYLTKELWEELTKYRNSGMFERGKDREILGNKDIVGKYININNGIRVTPNQPV
ncbi:MAG: hypothetical protein RLZZ534_964, partial [Actinomycetota bacterium]